MGVVNINIQNDNGDMQAFLRKFKLYKAKIVLPLREVVRAGPLVVGGAYFLNNNGAGDDFSNVGGEAVIDGGTYFYFIATGTTPAVWSNGSELKYTPLPIVTVMENDLGGSVNFEIFEDGPTVLVTSEGLFTLNKTIVKGDPSGATGLVTEPSNANEIHIQANQWRNSIANYIEIEVYS